ncbi:MAG TPA: MarR family transcriptional regulator [Rhodanobacteraceae bacterium]|nr:MarR family transcriptional regulator [Rhodanobacteraceae bacterium]
MGELSRHMRGIETGVAHVVERLPDLPVQDVMLLRLLKLASEGLSGRFIEILKPHGLSESDFRVLMQLYSSPNGRGFPGELCSFVVQTPTNMTRIADVLVARKLVTRRPSEQDRRRIELRITPTGRRFVDKLLPQLFPVLRASFSALNVREKRQLQELLQSVIASIDRDRSNPSAAH